MQPGFTAIFIKAFTISILLSLSTITNAICGVNAGPLMSKHELIKHSARIYLVKITRANAGMSSHPKTFKIVKTLKLDLLKRLLYTSTGSYGVGLIKVNNEKIPARYRSRHRSDNVPPLQNSDFDYHRDKSFWKHGIARNNPGPLDTCSPVHHFEVGKQYLLFPDFINSRYAAELIKDPDKDAWYQYVIKNRYR